MTQNGRSEGHGERRFKASRFDDSRMCRNVVLVQELTAAAFDIAVEELRAATRGRARCAEARQVAMYLCRVTLAWTYQQIGDAFGRDRTTATYACHKVEDLRDDVMYDRLISDLERTVSGSEAA